MTNSNNHVDVCRVKEEVIFCPTSQNRGMSDTEDELQIGSMIADCRDEEVRKIILKLNTKDPFETLQKSKCF